MLTLLALVLGGCGTAPEPQVTEPPPVEARVASEMLLLNWGEVKYVGDRTKPERTHEQALELASELVVKLRADPTAWPEMLAEYSDGPMVASGGRVESWPREQVPRDFAPVLSVDVGEFTDPLDAHLGVVVLKRVEPLGTSLLSGRRLVVAWQGANRAPAAVTRTPEEAKARAEELHARAVADPTGFEALVKAESDGWGAERGGFMGTWTVETARWPLAVEVALDGLAIGAISGPVRSQFGYELYQRLEPQPAAVQLAGAHLLISHSSASSSRNGRSKAEAKALADDLAAKAKADPSLFGTLAREHSDDAADRGGDLGTWKVGKLPEALEDTFLTMHFGEVAGPVESEFGYHLLFRRKAPADHAVDYRAPRSDPSLEEGMPDDGEYGVPGMEADALPDPHEGHDH